MNAKRARWAGLLALAALVCSGGQLLAADAAKKEAPTPEPVTLPKPAEVQGLAVYPTEIALKGADDARQLVLTATVAGGRPQDLTGDATYDVADPKVARVTSGGQVLPLANGRTEVTARYGDKAVKVSVRAEKVDENLP